MFTIYHGEHGFHGKTTDYTSSYDAREKSLFKESVHSSVSSVQPVVNQKGIYHGQHGFH